MLTSFFFFFFFIFFFFSSNYRLLSLNKLNLLGGSTNLEVLVVMMVEMRWHHCAVVVMMGIRCSH